MVGYRFLADLRRQQGSDVVDTRLFGLPVIGIGGPEAARLFYDESRMRRSGALPAPLRRTLFGEGGVHGLDGPEHRHRKALFMRHMTPVALDRLEEIAAWHWAEAIAGWDARREVVLFDEAARVLTLAAVEWVGVPLPAAGAHALARSLVERIDAFGSLGVRHVRGRLARARTEVWAGKVIADIRDGSLNPPKDSVAWQAAHQLDPKGRLLPPHVAAVELLNFVRPTVAVAWFVTFAAHALLAHRPDDPEAFTQEIRRFYPFVPFLGARARESFTWRGHEFPQGRPVLLDVYGTNHDPAVWPDPDSFDPQRFADRTPTRWDMIPQGGGDPHHGHRCAGEDPSIRLIKQAVIVLSSLDYEVPVQDLSIPLDRMPTKPRSGFVIADVTRRAPVGSPG